MRHLANRAGLALALLWSDAAFADDRLTDDVLACRDARDGRATVVEFTTTAAEGSEIPIRGLLSRPDGKGPFPAVVLLHRVFGVVAPSCMQDARRRLREWGYVSLLVDSDSPPDPARKRLYAIGGYTFEEQARDAHGARRFLAGLDAVDGGRIAVVGYAYGGSSALLAALGRSDFKAAVAWHPACDDSRADGRTPLLVIVGEQDDRNSAAACRRMAEAAPGAFPLLRVAAGAGHNFDAYWERTFDAAATEAAYEEMRRFLAKHLR